MPQMMKRYLVVRDRKTGDDAAVEYHVPRIAGWADAVEEFGEHRAVEILQRFAETNGRTMAAGEARWKREQAEAGLAIASQGHVKKVVAR